MRCSSVDVEACHAPWAAAHAAALAAGRRSYSDPATGYDAFTELGLLAQGGCCGAKCRHCPYGQQHVPPAARDEAALPARPVLLRARRRTGRAPSPPLPPDSAVRLWEGRLDATAPAGSVVCVCFDARSGHTTLLPEGCQEGHLHAAMDALRAAGLDAVAVPVESRSGAGEQAAAGLAEALVGHAVLGAEAAFAELRRRG